MSARLSWAGLCVGFGTLALAIVPGAEARITNLQITTKTSPAFGGQSFGAVGQYEQIDGTAFGEIDPNDRLNAIIQDIELAPRNVRGMVEYSMDFSILKPINTGNGNHTILYDVVNRGNKSSPAINIGGTATAAGDGFLESEGYTLVWSGWEGDITTGIKIVLPIAKHRDGSAITGAVRGEYILSAPATTVNVSAPPAYEAVSTSNAGAVLTQRVHQDDPKERIDNANWAFADCAATPFPGVPSTTKVCLKGGFDTNHIYELVYTAKNPTVTGIGFAATRDFISFLRNGNGKRADDGDDRRSDRDGDRDRDDRHGGGDKIAAVAAPPNPLGDSIDLAIIYGSSQSGRWIRTWLQLGFNEDEHHRQVTEGAIPHKSSNRGAFNIRFAQPTRLSGTQHTERQYPGQESPQTWDVSHDPLAHITAGQLERCRKTDTCPKITATVTDTEYWQSLMALNTTDALGKHDLELPRNVRIYHFAGTQHGGGDPLAQPPTVQPKPPANCQLPVNSNPFIPAQRALLVALQQWIADGKEPPPSLYPSLRHGSLVPANKIKVPYIPAVNFTLPGLAAQRFHLDRGRDFDEEDVSGVMDEPPVKGEAYALLLPQVDADGNDIDGLRNTNMAAPLGTYSGWNPRKAGFSEGDSCDLTGGFIPFFKTKAERLAAGDPRPSLEERYPTHAIYVAKVTAAANKLVQQRLLLQQDADLIIGQANAAAVP